jgi:TPR repeat protein
LQWLKKAAEMGDPEALYNMGVLTQELAGEGSLEEAINWFRRADEAGLPQAKAMLERLNKAKN